ncbi:MAG: ADP-ribosylation factor-like protein [Candidatus Hodarchaeota archaeon]
MEELIKSSVINGLIFSAYDKLGPQPIYCFPNYVSKEELDEIIKREDRSNILRLTLRDYTQISIKSLTLLIGDGSILETVDIENFQYFGVIPYPDFDSTSLTFFHFIKRDMSEIPLATAFSILIDENKRSFLYNNMERLKILILDFFKEFDKELGDDFKSQTEVEAFFETFMKKLIDIEKSPSTPFTTHRKMKILFAGLDDSGKTSFLLSVDRKFSKLIGLKPTIGAKVSSIEALGATIFLWDLGGQLKLRKSYLNKAQIYLYEADLLFYFIDIKNPKRFEESIEYLNNIKKVLANFNQNTPIVYILSKGDPDIADLPEIKLNIKKIKNLLVETSNEPKLEIYITSIFEIFTILRAFSAGIAKLSPNRDLIKLNLRNFSKEIEIYLTLLLSDEGLVLAEYLSPQSIELTKLPDPNEIMNVFELTAPQFTILFKIFSQYKKIPQNEAIFKVSDSIVLFKRISIADFEMFILFLMENEKNKEKVNSKLPNFLNLTQDLLLRYIS